MLSEEFASDALHFVAEVCFDVLILFLEKTLFSEGQHNQPNNVAY